MADPTLCPLPHGLLCWVFSFLGFLTLGTLGILVHFRHFFSLFAPCSSLLPIHIDIDPLAGFPYIFIDKVNDPVKSQKTPFSVIPAEAGIQEYRGLLDPGFRRGDGMEDFLRTHQV